MSTPKACVRCSKSHNDAKAFLLCCSECRRFWHHRTHDIYVGPAFCVLITIPITGCHLPPIQDTELIARLKATKDNDVDNGLDAWVCKRCSKRILESSKVSLPTDRIVPKPIRIPDVVEIPQSPKTKAISLVSPVPMNQGNPPSVQVGLLSTVFATMKVDRTRNDHTDYHIYAPFRCCTSITYPGRSVSSRR
jgi:hypothetical protein